jgi:hypothetical protein
MWYLVLIEQVPEGCYECGGGTGRTWKWVQATDGEAACWQALEAPLGHWDSDVTLTAFPMSGVGLSTVEVMAPPAPPSLIDHDSILGRTIANYIPFIEDGIFLVHPRQEVGE